MHVTSVSIYRALPPDPILSCMYMYASQSHLVTELWELLLEIMDFHLLEIVIILKIRRKIGFWEFKDPISNQVELQYT